MLLPKKIPQLQLMFHINLNSDEIDQLSIYETCIVCSALCEHILTHLKEIVMVYKPIEQFYFSKCQRFIFKYIDIIKRVTPDKKEISDKTTNIKIYDINCMVMNQRMRVSLVKVSPDLLSFQLAGSATLIKLINVVLQSALVSLSKRKTFSLHYGLLERCSQKMHEITRYMLTVFSLTPNCGKHLTLEETKFLSIVAIMGRDDKKEKKQKRIVDKNSYSFSFGPDTIK
jgi:hypothetical protein